MAPRVVVVDHRDSYVWSLVHLLASVTGELPTVVQHDETSPGALAAYSHVVLSPGPGAPDVAADFALGRAVFDLDVPLLGVCLGMQALVAAYGGRVARVEPAHGEVATLTHEGTGVLRDVPDGATVVRYHSLAAVDVVEPLVVTARADDGTVMAVRHRERPQHGVQFHPESVLSEHGRALVAAFLEPPTWSP